MGCARESADELFRKGEEAAHVESSYPQAEKHLEAFLYGYPDDPRADVALQALARVHLSQGKTERAIVRYEELVERFPKSRYADQAQFMIGYTYDQAGSYERAREAYQRVIDRYPQSELSDDARISIANLGRPPEAWIPPD
jgi:TolA-binding protein